jgi:hypothetical protein
MSASVTTTMPTPCTICFEDYAADQVVAFDCCRQQGACAPCWTRWFTICEAKGLVAPCCVVCRGPVTTAEAFLGRPYQAAAIAPMTAGGQHKKEKGKLPTIKDLDDGTTAWLVHHEARGCHDCGTWMTRADGSNAVTCYCGNRLCWECDGEGGECLCVQLMHVYGNQNSVAVCPETTTTTTTLEDCKPSETETTDATTTPAVTSSHPPEESKPAAAVVDVICCAPHERTSSDHSHSVTPARSFAPDDIWTACKMGDLPYVTRALQARPHLLMAEYNGRTPLFLASLCGQTAVVDYLLRAGALDPGGLCYQSALGDACRARLKRARQQRQQQHEKQQPPSQKATPKSPPPTTTAPMRRRPRRTRMPSTRPGQTLFAATAAAC